MLAHIVLTCLGRLAAVKIGLMNERRWRTGMSTPMYMDRSSTNTGRVWLALGGSGTVGKYDTWYDTAVAVSTNPKRKTRSRRFDFRENDVTFSFMPTRILPKLF